MAYDPQLRLPLPELVVDFDFESSACELPGADLVTYSWREATGSVELDEAPARIGKPLLRCTLQDEEIAYAIEG